MKSLLQKKEINTSRQLNLDLLKAISVISMIICHPVVMLGAHLPDHEIQWQFIFADSILGTYFGVAHAFMFCMGIALCYSKKQTPKDIFLRGLKVYLLGYVLNFFRYGIYAIGGSIMFPEFIKEIPLAIAGQDILHFAGIALMLTALFKKLKFNLIIALIIGIVMNILGTLIGIHDFYNIPLNVIAGTFIYTTRAASCFPLLHWYLFVALGLVFGNILRRVENLDKFYSRLLIVSSIVCVIYIVLTCVFGRFFLSTQNCYYTPSVLEAAGLLSIDLTAVSVFYFLLKNKTEENMPVIINLSRWVTRLYFIHWLFLGFIDSFVFWLLGISMAYWQMYLTGVILVFVSYLIQMFLSRQELIRQKILKK